MDAKLFRLPTNPNFYSAIATANPFDVGKQQGQNPTPDARFPGWAAPMADGRLVTDYRNHCSFNVPTGSQFATKKWLTKNATDIIRLSRDRMAEKTGAIYGLDTSIVPLPAVIVKCQTNNCERVRTNYPGGIGIERLDVDTPELFGTWTTKTLIVPPIPGRLLTTKFEGGRNTPRG
jgi:hypothetical protein